MEIVNSKKIKSFVWITISITLILIIVPLIFYFSVFHYSLSEDTTDWGSFGDFFGGIIGTFLNLVATIFSLISIYVTLKIASRIHESEQEFSHENLNREKERFEKEIELVHLQNKPYLFVDLNISNEMSEVIITNHGTGTLIITEWSLEYNGEIFSNFRKLFEQKIDNFDNHYSYTLRTNHDIKIILSPGANKCLVEIKPINNIDNYFNIFKESCNNILDNAIIKFTYEDIFGNEENYYEGLKLHLN